MKKIVQAVAGFNAVFQLVVGLLSVVSPLTAAAAFKVEGESPVLLALIRMFGGLLASSGIISALIAKNPDRDRGLVRAYAGCLLLNVAADVVVIASGELRFDQLAVGMVLELVLATLLVARYSLANSA
jgi:Domain of unknown function (DUF4345)